MLETATLIALCMLFLIFVRPGMISICWRLPVGHGLWLFHAVRPVSGETSAQFKTVSEFSSELLARYPLEGESLIRGEDIVAAVQSVSLSRGVQVKTITC
jgi:hypothetical protein